MYFQGIDFQIIFFPNIFERKTFLSNGGSLKPVFLTVTHQMKIPINFNRKNSNTFKIPQFLHLTICGLFCGNNTFM